MTRRESARRRPSLLDIWVEAGRGDEQAAVLARAARAMATARGLDPDAVDELLGPARPRPADPPPLESVDDLGALHLRTITDTSERKAGGAFYTPPALADALVDATLGPLLGPRRTDPLALRVADPSCGAGAFLLRVVRRIAARSDAPDARAEAIRSCIAGVDRAPLAAALCRTSLWLDAADRRLEPGALAARIVVGDALLGDDTEAALVARLGSVSWDVAFAPELGRGGFDAVVGNPPWDVDKPDARAFFARFDPEHRRRRKQDAARLQRELCVRDASIATAWAEERALFEARARFCRARFRLRPEAGDANAYQRFVELGLELLREDGRLGMLVPAGIYADLGSRALRRELLDHNRWERLCGFENRERLFPDVDGRFKLAAIVVTRGGRTKAVEASFMQRDPAALLRPGLRVQRTSIRRTSPRSAALVEVDDARALELIERLCSRGVAFGDRGPRGWRIAFRREFDLTLDSHRFVAPGPAPDRLPLWEGRMIGAYDFAEKGWVEGHGRSATWRTLDWPDKAIEPQYAVPVDELARVDPASDRPKVGFMAIGSATNARTMIATVLWRAPCGNSVPTLRCRAGLDEAPGELALCAALDSTVYDFALRARLAGNNLNRFVLEDTPLPAPDALLGVDGLSAAVASLCWAHPWFDDAWATLPARERARANPLREPHARRRVRAALDAVVAGAFGIDGDDLRFIQRDCDLPTGALARAARAGSLDPKGLWRVDRGLPPEERTAALALAAFDQLEAARARGVPFAAAASELLVTTLSTEHGFPP